MKTSQLCKLFDMYNQMILESKSRVILKQI